jgi:crotonobetainyl-CoA:carnitine CoA-transferase CaiB-like acyl-CoA transferase
VNVYDATDGAIYIQAGTNSLFPKLCAAMGRDDLAADPRYATVRDRMARQEELEAAVAAWAARRTRDEIGRALDEVGVPYSPIATIAEAAATRQVAAREMIVEMVHPALGPLRIPGSPIKLGGSPVSYRKAPPTVGEDTDDVLSRVLGLTPTAIAELRSQGVI